MGGNSEKSVIGKSEYELFLDKMSNLAYFIDDQGAIVWVNQAVADTLEVPQKELIGREFLPFFRAEDKNNVIDNYRLVLEGNPRVAVHTLITGTTCRFSTFPHYDDDGKIIGAFGVGENITKQLQVECALKDSEERFKAIHDASFGGIAIHDKGVILECNHGLCDMTGFEYDELIGMNGLLLISEKTRPLVIENINGQFERPYEAEGVRKNGETYPLRIEGREIPYKGKNVRVVEFRDITKEKEAEAHKESLESQLQQAQKLEVVGRLAGGVAHDFNNMLTAIIGNAELALAKTNESSLIRGELNEIEKAARRSADLTRQLLAFSRKQTISPKVLNLNETLSDLTRMLTRLIGEDIKLSFEPKKGLWPIKVDPSQVDQILTNLCINSRDAIDGTGLIEIKLDNVVIDGDYQDSVAEIANGEYVKLSISDDGRGMDKETILHIFEPFFTTKSMGKGTGLGLATVYGAVKQNKGHIKVESKVGEGTTFDLLIPRYVSDKGHVRASELRLLSNHGTETILIVEDEPAILNVAARQLNKLGYSVIAANSPNEALEIAQEFENEIHLLLTDVVMPEMNGKELAQGINSLFPNIKVLYMSGYTADVIGNHGVLKEGLRLLEKPFSIEELASSVREALDN